MMVPVLEFYINSHVSNGYFMFLTVSKMSKRLFFCKTVIVYKVFVEDIAQLFFSIFFVLW